MISIYRIEWHVLVMPTEALTTASGCRTWHASVLCTALCQDVTMLDIANHSFYPHRLATRRWSTHWEVILGWGKQWTTKRDTSLTAPADLPPAGTPPCPRPRPPSPWWPQSWGTSLLSTPLLLFTFSWLPFNKFGNSGKVEMTASCWTLDSVFTTTHYILIFLSLLLVSQLSTHYTAHIGVFIVSFDGG